ncbi:MDR family MFS transporter [Lysinibacter sp. HNR]|uniref:MDR family MFS transporter n=1 Tax=Lysinibacter sp. HNR TaxID=3031408 RepID=UPI002435BDEE|nr:MDR family MFS transporter [Lysinibacter sp. HNR]WGD36581.1 MDR family MFS transporter [Lysinibacter sp. HNR]
MVSSQKNPAENVAPVTNPIMTQKQIIFVVIGLMMGMFLSALDQTVVSTSMRTIADDLDGLSLQAWVTTAYLITSTVTTPIYGKLSDIFGRRIFFILAIVLFITGSILASLSASMYQLAIFRAFQGIGAGGLMALPLAIMGDIIAPRQRAKYQGYFLAMYGVASVIGPILGGLFAGTPHIFGIAGWRWVFLINVPIAIVAIIVVIALLRYPFVKHQSRIDWWGAATIVIGVVPLLLVADQGRLWGWGSPLSLLCYTIAVLGITAFILREKKVGESALIPLKLFRQPTFRMATIISVLAGFILFGAMQLVPLYLQIVNGSTPTQAGLQMLPLIVGMMVATITTGQIIAYTGKYRVFPILGTGMASLGFGILLALTPNRPLPILFTGMVFVGLGLGQLMQTLTISAQNSVTGKDMGVATSSITFFRQMGATLGTAVIFSVMFSRMPTTLSEAFKNPSLQAQVKAAIADPKVTENPANAGILKVLREAEEQGGGSVSSSLDGDTSFLTGADHRLAEPFIVGFNQAALTTFAVVLVVALLAFVLAWFLKPAQLREHSSLQEQVDEERAIWAAQAAAAHAGTPTIAGQASPILEPEGPGKASDKSEQDRA